MRVENLQLTAGEAGFEIVEQRDDEAGAVELRLVGELDLSVIDQVEGRLDALAREGVSVRLDLAELQFIDSTGIRALLMAARRAAQEGWSLEVSPTMTRPVERVIRLVCADRVLWPGESS